MTSSPAGIPAKKSSRRTVALVLGGMIAAPIVIDKLRGAYELYLKPQPLLRILAQPRSVSDFEFEDAAGRTLSLKDLKGKYILLNVWATWCPPCRKEMPSLDRFQSLVLGKSQLRVVALSVDRGGFPQLQAFYDVIGVKSLDLYRGDEPSVLSALGIAGLPTTLLLNPDGKEIARLVGPTEWDEPQILTQILGLINTNG